MDRFALYFNELSLPVDSSDIAFKQFLDTLQGLIQLSKGSFSGKETYIGFEKEDFKDILLSDGYSIRDFLQELEDYDIDTYDFFLELETRSPIMSFTTDDLVYKIIEEKYIINGWSTGTDIHLTALIEHDFLLSLPNHGWGGAFITCYGKSKNLELKNICSLKTANIHIPNSTKTTQRMFELTFGKAYIYHGDHPPPHIHIRGPNSKCSISLRDTDYGECLCGNLSEKDSVAVKEFLTTQTDLNAIWNEVNPIRNMA